MENELKVERRGSGQNRLYFKLVRAIATKFNKGKKPTDEQVDAIHEHVKVLFFLDNEKNKYINDLPLGFASSQLSSPDHWVFTYWLEAEADTRWGVSLQENS